MGQGTDTCADRPTEVSVIRFVSRNRTIEEIAPKKEVYTCKQRGCGKIFTNQDEYKTHEALEALKIRFICREPGCGEELSDPGSMWRHYQEWHNNETNVFICPYTNCGSLQTTSSNLEEHIESSHRQPPTLPTEPEIICFEGPEGQVQSSEEYEKRGNKGQEMECSNEDLKKEDFREDSFHTKCEDEKTSSVVYINGDVTITKKEHRLELDRIFRGDLETLKSEETNSNCSDDEEYTPKKQRMSRYKQEIYKCSMIGCGKKYKYISHYRHHQDSHKLLPNTPAKTIGKLKQEKASTVSFFLCKIPGCGAQVNNVTGLWKHYQDNHATSKLPSSQGTKPNALFRCKIPGCGLEFSTTGMLYKHFDETHSNGSTNSKTGNCGSFHYVDLFEDDIPGHGENFKTDFKPSNASVNEFAKFVDSERILTIGEDESRD